MTIFALGMTAFLCAQTARSDDENFQSWNELQVTVPLAKKFDLVLQASARIGGNATQLTEGRFGSAVIWKATAAFSFSPSYNYIETRNSAGVFHTEHRFNLRGTYKFPVKRFGLSHRSLVEFRVRTSGNSWRYRPSLTFEKAISEKLIHNAKVFLTEEPFYVSTTGKFSRNRISVGVSKILNKNITLDVYYLRQNDGFSHPGDLNVLGTSWKVRL